MHERVDDGPVGPSYSATHTEAPGKFAIDIIADDDRGARRRFIDGAGSLAGLRHPHIIPTYEPFEEVGHLYVPRGVTTGRPLQWFPIPSPLDWASTVSRQIADAMAYAHEQAVVHGALEPNNILVDASLTGIHVGLVNWGLARLWHQAQSVAHRRDFGTPWFLPPEVLGGDSPGPAADVYAFGVSLYILLTGQWPFDRSGPPSRDVAIAVIERAHRSGIERLGRLAPSIPPPTEALVMACLSAYPEARPADGAELATALAAGASPGIVPPPGVVGPPDTLGMSLPVGGAPASNVPPMAVLGPRSGTTRSLSTSGPTSGPTSAPRSGTRSGPRSSPRSGQYLAPVDPSSNRGPLSEPKRSTLTQDWMQCPACGVRYLHRQHARCPRCGVEPRAHRARSRLPEWVLPVAALGAIAIAAVIFVATLPNRGSAAKDDRPSTSGLSAAETLEPPPAVKALYEGLIVPGERIGPIRIGMTLDDVERKLGPPSSTQVSSSYVSGSRQTSHAHTLLKYRDLNLTVRGTSVRNQLERRFQVVDHIQITCRRSAPCPYRGRTPRGIGLMSTRGQVEAIFSPHRPGVTDTWNPKFPIGIGFEIYKTYQAPSEQDDPVIGIRIFPRER